MSEPFKELIDSGFHLLSHKEKRIALQEFARKFDGIIVIGSGTIHWTQMEIVKKAVESGRILTICFNQSTPQWGETHHVNSVIDGTKPIWGFMPHFYTAFEQEAYTPSFLKLYFVKDALKPEFDYQTHVFFPSFMEGRCNNRKNMTYWQQTKWVDYHNHGNFGINHVIRFGSTGVIGTFFATFVLKMENVFLIGMDAYYPAIPGKCLYYLTTREFIANKKTERQQRAWNNLTKFMDDYSVGANIFNCSETTKLKFFPIMDLEKALSLL